jgi:hypothetical protein
VDTGLLSILSWYRPGEGGVMLYGIVPLVFCMLVIGLLRLRLPALLRIESVLATKWAVLAIGVLSAVAFRYEWSTLRELPLVHDEAAYVLQARLFAAGQWTDSAPIPEFFEQPHVLVTPRLAEKYGPGNALMLVPGIWLDRPGLMPVIALAVTGALIFVLGRRIVSPWVGIFAWMVWLGLVPPETTFRPSYFSEILTEGLWLGAWWALLRWRDEKRGGFLVLTAACIGWMALTRPLTAVAFAAPVGVVVLWLTWRRRSWSQLGAAFVTGLAFLSVIPLWSARTTGDWRVTPLMLYTDQYMPYDVVGFGLRDKAPLREPSPETACFADMYTSEHRWHTPGVIPAAFSSQGRAAAAAFFTERRHGLIFFAVVGVLASPVELGFALATCAALLLAYTTFAHAPGWTVYALETQSVCALLAAAGIWAVSAAVGRRWGRSAAIRSGREPGVQLASWCTLAFVVLAIWPTIDAITRVRVAKASGDVPHKLFRQAVDSLPAAKKIVFVRYPKGEGCQQNLIQNNPPLATAETWIVSDRGDDDLRLLRAAPDRVPYLFDAKTFTMRRFPSGAHAPDETDARHAPD